MVDVGTGTIMALQGLRQMSERARNGTLGQGVELDLEKL